MDLLEFFLLRKIFGKRSVDINIYDTREQQEPTSVIEQCKEKRYKMGLDLTVSVTKDFKTNENGQTQWTVVELANLRNCWDFADILDINNGSTMTFDGYILNGFLERLENKVEKTRINELIKFENEETYDIHCWY